MARKCFYSFHYKPDNWRASTIRQIGAIEGSRTVSDNDWESVTRGGDSAIEKWIADQMHGKSCTILLIGAETAGRKWIEHEIIKTWNDKKGIFGIYIHNLLDRNSKTSTKGSNPFSPISLKSSGTSLSNIVKAYAGGGGSGARTINTQTANYTLQLIDAGCLVEMNVASANNLTVPDNATVAFALGTQIDVAQYGAGQTTIVPGAGVTIVSVNSNRKLFARYSTATLYKRATNEWLLTGDLVA